MANRMCWDITYGLDIQSPNPGMCECSQIALQRCNDAALPILILRHVCFVRALWHGTQGPKRMDRTSAHLLQPSVTTGPRRSGVVSSISTHTQARKSWVKLRVAGSSCETRLTTPTPIAFPSHNLVGLSTGAIPRGFRRLWHSTHRWGQEWTTWPPPPEVGISAVLVKASTTLVGV